MTGLTRFPRTRRRTFLQATGSAVVAACCGGLSRVAARQSADAPPTTLRQSAAPGSPRVPGLPYRVLEPAGGWPLVTREDLVFDPPEAPAQRRALVSFVHLTDIHIVDAASPGHPAFVRQYNTSYAGSDFVNGFRAQETLTTHVVTTMIDRLNAIGGGPISGRPFDFAICTGDNADSRAQHELTSLLTAFNGGTIAFNAAGGIYQGMQDNATDQPAAVYDAFWHPEAPPTGFEDDAWKRMHGYPTFADFLAAVSQPVPAAGLAMPWYGGFGNHDGLLLGVAPSFAPAGQFLETLAPGGRQPLTLPADMPVETFIELLSRASPTELATLLGDLITRPVPAAASRASFTRKQFISQHLADPGRFGPDGHGFSAANVDANTAYYQFTLTPGITGLMLDTTNPNGGADGSLDPTQAAWLKAQLEAVHGRYLSPTGEWITTKHEDQLVVLFSHHNSITFENLTTAPGETTSDRLNWAAFSALVARFPNVILWVNGHTHTNRIWAHPDYTGNTGGYWEVNTAAHIDYPQESRIVEIIDNGNGYLSIIGVMVDAADASIIPTGPPYTVESLAALALELAANDPALDLPFRLGTVSDRNVELLIKRPF